MEAGTGSLLSLLERGSVDVREGEEDTLVGREIRLNGRRVRVHLKV